MLDGSNQLDDTRGELRGQLEEECQARADGDREAPKHADECIAEALSLEAISGFVILIGLAIATAQTGLC